MPAKMNATDLHNALGRLPKWAQDHIRLLQQRITEQEQHISQLSTGPEARPGTTGHVRRRRPVRPGRHAT